MNQTIWTTVAGLFLVLEMITAQGADRAAPVHPVDGSFAREWLVLGPIPSKDMEIDFRFTILVGPQQVS